MSALQQPVEQSHHLISGHYSDDIDVGVSRKRGRRVSASSVATLQSIKSLDSSWDPDTTVRLSIMPHGKDRSATQMCIPPGLVSKVKFDAVCKEEKDDVKDQHVNYSSWKNVKGEKGT